MCYFRFEIHRCSSNFLVNYKVIHLPAKFYTFEAQKMYIHYHKNFSYRNNHKKYMKLQIYTIKLQFYDYNYNFNQSPRDKTMTQWRGQWRVN